MNICEVESESMNQKRIKDLDRGNKSRPQRVIYRGTVAELVEYLKGEALTHKAFYHYTQWDRLANMMAPVADGGDAEGHRLLYLSQATALNDKIERQWGKRVFLTCFSYSKYENVAMWMNYGKRSPNAIRIKFDGAKVKQLIKKLCKKKPVIFGHFESKGKFKRIPTKDIASVDFADVAYVMHSKLLNRKNRGNVESGRDFFEVCDQNGGKAWSNAVYDGNSAETLPPFFKKRGWAYERETRLAITLKSDAKIPKRIAIVFDSVIDKLDASFNSGGMQKGPWYRVGRASRKTIGRDGIGLSDVTYGSDYSNEVKIILD